MTSQETARQVLARLCEQLGGAEKAAQRLFLPPRLLASYITGEERIPNTVFLRAVDALGNPSP